MPLSPRALSAESSLRDRCRSIGAMYLEGTYKSGSEPFQFICACGARDSGIWNPIRQGRNQLLCHDCSKVRSSGICRAVRKVMIWPQIIQMAERWGAIPLESSYSTSKSLVSFQCRCGAPAARSWNDIKSGSKMLCSQCSDLDLPRRENHPRWRHDLSVDQRHHRSHIPGYRSWIREVKANALDRCQITGLTSERLSAHHIYNWAHYSELRLNPENGICLAYSVHKRFHRIFGNGPNTHQQLVEFCISQYGVPCPVPDPLGFNP